MAWRNKKQLQINNTSNKNFDYAKGDVNLKFSLRTDVKDQLNDFLDLLKIATKEVEDEIKK
ncbi:MAG: hypothetical protein WCO07_01380 [bacterium]